MKVLKGILGQLAFFTIIPVGKTDFELTMEYSFLAPIIVGLVTGGIDYIVLRGLYLVLGGVVSILLIPIVEIIRGFNHLDGLLDFGDALMIRGSSEDRRKALRDVSVGAGGIGLAIVYITIFFM